MGSHTLQKFTRFSTDSVGLERTLRLFQAIIQIVSSYTSLFNWVVLGLPFVSDHPPSPTETAGILVALRQRLALGRRYLRLFRFLDAFNNAYKQYTSLSLDQPVKAANGKSPRPQRASWAQSTAYLDIFGATFNGMYLILETSTIIDAMDVPGLSIWGPELTQKITVEAQRFWLFALVCGVLGCSLKILDALALTPVPESSKAYGLTEEKEGERTVAENKGTSVDDGASDREGWDLQREQKRLRNVVKKRTTARSQWRREVVIKIRKLVRGAIANTLDMALPGSIIGWIELEPGTVGVAMFITTILTSMDVWERCGREVLG